MSAFNKLGRPDDHRSQGRQVPPGQALGETEKPKAPDRLEAIETTTDGIELEWVPVESNRLYGYRLERSRSTAFKNIWRSAHDPKPVLPAGVTNFTIDDVKPYGNYDFCVKSAVTNKESNLLYSDPGCILRNVVAKEQYQPYPPRDFKVQDIDEESVSLRWKKPLPDDDYRGTPVSYEYIIEMCDYADDKIYSTWKECYRTKKLQCTVKVKHNGTCRFSVTTHNGDKNISSLRLELRDPQVRITIVEKNGDTIKEITSSWPVARTTPEDIESGSIVFVVSCQDMEGLRELWMNYNLGKLENFFQDWFGQGARLAPEVSNTDIDLDITIDREDVHSCRRHLMLTCTTDRGFRVVNLEEARSKATIQTGLIEDYPVYCKPLLKRTTSCSQLDFLDPAMPTNQVTGLGSAVTRQESSRTRERSPGTVERSPGTRKRSPGTVKRTPGTRERSLETVERSPGTVERSPGTRERSPGTIERSPGTVERSPGTVKRTPGTRERSPGTRERSPGLRERSPGTVERSPGTVERLPLTRERSSETVERSPGTVERSPGTVERSPGTVERSPLTRERSPGTVERSPGTVKRSYGTRERSPGTVERSPLTRERSPETVERSPGTRERSPGIVERSPRTGMGPSLEPRPITSISVTEQTTTTIKVKWRAAKDKDATYIAHITGKDPVRVGKALEYDFDELDPGTSYDISIKVKRTLEDGREVGSRPCKTKASTCPARPEDFHVKSCSPCSITVAWQPPVGCIDFTKVEIWCAGQTKSRGSGQKPEQSQIIAKDITECVFDSLPTNPGSLHRITISSHFQDLSSEIAEITQRTKLCSPDLKLCEKTETSVTISWEHVKGEKEKYTLSIFSYEGKTDEVIPCHGNKNYHSFQNLVPGKEYKVSAITIYEDAESEPCVLIVRTTVPPPQNITVIKQSITTHSFAVRWDKAVGEIGCYVVRYTCISRSYSQYKPLILMIDPEHQQAELTDLIPGVGYSISVSSKSGDDESTPEKVIQSTKVLPITDVEVRTGPTHIQLSWKHPGGCVESYILRSSHSGELSIYPPRHTKTYNNLVPGTKYIIELETESCGLRSGSQFFKEVITDPLPPEMVIFEHVGTDNAVVKWCKPEGKVDRYILSIEPDESKSTHVQWNDVTTYTFSSLGPGQRYKLSMVSEVLHGQLTWGTISTPIEKIFYTRPLPPLNLQITDISEQSFQISWESPDNGTFDNVRLGLYNGNNDPHYKSLPAGTNKHRFTGLASGRIYGVEICAKSGDRFSEKGTTTIQTDLIPPSISVPEAKINPTSIALHYELPNSDCDKCVIVLSSTNTTDSKSIKVEITQPQWQLDHTFEDLTPGEKYKILATAYSGAINKESQPLSVMTRLEKPKKIKALSLRKYKDIIANLIEHLGRKVISVDSTKPFRTETSGEDKSNLATAMTRTTVSQTDPDQIGVKVQTESTLTTKLFGTKTSGEDKSDIATTMKRTAASHTDQMNGKERPESTLTTKLFGTKTSGEDKSDLATTIKRTSVSRIEQISVKERTESTLTITWHNAKGKKSSYIAFISEMNGKMPLQHFPNIRARSLSLPYSQTFTNLTPGRMYKVSVVTVSGEMESLPRNMYVRTIVSPPRNVKIPQDSVTEHSMDVVWEDARGDWEAYEHIIWPKEGSARYIGKESLYGTVVYRSRFENLTAGKMYRIGMFTRIEGVGSEVALLEGNRTKVAAVDENSIKFTNVSETEVTLEWKQAAGEKDSYTVTIHSSSDDTAVVKSPSAEIKADDELLHTFTDLTPGQKYTISIVTFKENVMSSHVNKTIHTKPNKPEGFRVETFAESIAVYWDSPLGVQDGYLVEIRTVPDDPDWFIKATFDEKTHPSNNEGAGIRDESDETRPWQSFKYTFREKGTIKARTKYKISARTQSGKKQSGGQCSHVVSVEERTKPHPPRDPRLVKEGMESVTLSWAPPMDEEQRRDIHRYIVKYKGPDDEDEREHDCQFNTSAKIKRLRNDTEYDFFVISVVETTTEEGKQERVESNKCRFTFKTMSQNKKVIRKFSKRMYHSLFIICCCGTLIISLALFFAVYINNCVRLYEQSKVDTATVIPSTNVSNNTDNISSATPTSSSAQSYNSSLNDCLIEKTKQFWYFLFIAAVPAVCFLAILLWKVVKRVRNRLTHTTDGEILTTLLEESAIEMTDMYSDEDKPRLEYGKKTTRQMRLFGSLQLL